MDKFVEIGPGVIKADNDENIIPDGRFLLKEKYPILYATMQEMYGDKVLETELEFAVPDYRGKVIEW